MLLFSLVLVLCFQNVSAQNAYQNISVKINVSESIIEVVNKVSLPNDLLDSKHNTYLYLNKNLSIESVKGGKITEGEITAKIIPRKALYQPKRSGH